MINEQAVAPTRQRPFAPMGSRFIEIFPNKDNENMYLPQSPRGKCLHQSQTHPCINYETLF
jgi:hypothetical protein